ncbi:MAG: sodium-coupled permease [Planctomycetaceae bacterium]
MTIWDFLVIGLFGLMMLAIGRYYSNRTQSADDYLLGGRNLNPFMVGLSLFATLTSTLSYLAYPGEIVKHGPMIFASMAGFPVVFFIVGWLLIPSIMKLNATSAYELLEARLGRLGRLLGSGMFISLRMIWMAAILYATTATVVVPIFKLDPKWIPLICAAMGAFTVIYTTAGGFRAVIMTDAIQSLVMIGGAIVTIGLITWSLGGVDPWFPDHWLDHWAPPEFWHREGARFTFVGAITNMLVWMICTTGSDQMAVQRYLSTRDVRAARWTLAVHLASDVVVATLLGLMGLAVLGYYFANTHQFAGLIDIFANEKSADKLFPQFIVVGLPPGMTGLIIAAILSAALSSLSSGVNSSCAVITHDFMNIISPRHLTPREGVRRARIVSAVVGVVIVLLSMFIQWLFMMEYVDNLIALCMKVVNLLTAPIFVLFFLAMFIPWSTPIGGLFAVIAAVTVAIGVAFFEWWGLNFLFIGAMSLIAGIGVGILVSGIERAIRGKRPDNTTVAG